MNKQQFAKEFIERLGGTSAVARICQCSPASVSEWKQTGIPKARLQFLQLKYKKLCKEIEKELSACQPIE